MYSSAAGIWNYAFTFKAISPFPCLSELHLNQFSRLEIINALTLNKQLPAAATILTILRIKKVNDSSDCKSHNWNAPLICSAEQTWNRRSFQLNGNPHLDLTQCTARKIKITNNLILAVHNCKNLQVSAFFKRRTKRKHRNYLFASAEIVCGAWKMLLYYIETNTNLSTRLGYIYH